ncbi:MAG TPA: 23S rRNA (pseudouridine(1915)-N(3))-methyltransferase RlmH [Polyangiaceae bacterium]|nr:23S rRNA (pseudouridine(1915)-N(3))-methyltransferase RlmH [Polyangiaceae bacterium]
MKLVVVAAGKIKERELRAVADDYLGRLKRYARCDEIETRDASSLAKSVPDAAFVVALEVDGDRLTSSEFAARLERWGSRGKGIVAFVIGAAEGIPKELSSRADVRLSLSSFTLPHRLARVVLLEQIYRAMTLQRGEPYAREE